MCCRSMTSRKHICLSLVKKYQLKISNYLLSEQDNILFFDTKNILSKNFENIPTYFLSEHVSYYSQIELVLANITTPILLTIDRLGVLVYIQRTLRPY